ncbi:MAG TPA: hypothetical protein VIC08_09525, partial [Cellvibrionaceae bacterium]
MKRAKALLTVLLWGLMTTAAASAEQAPLGTVSATADPDAEQAPGDIDGWRERRGISPVLMQLYQSYAPEILYQLADSGDIYALQAAYLPAEQAGNRGFAYSLLIRAAALDSTAALIMAGESLEHASPLLAVAHYLVAALRGEVDLADIRVEQLIIHRGRSFTDDQWQQIEMLADLLA